MVATFASPADAARGAAFLADNGWIADWPDTVRPAVLSLCEWRHHAASEVITCAGDAGSDVFAMATGAAGFTSALGPPDAHLTYVIHPGEWFGFAPLFTQAPRNGSVVARMPCLIARIDGTVLARMLAANTAWWPLFGRFAIRYGNIAAGVVADLMIRDSSRRCLATLLRLAGARLRTPAQRPVQVLASQDDVGALANLSRNSVNRILAAAQARGLIDIGYNCITLTQPDALRAIVDEG